MSRRVTDAFVFRICYALLYRMKSLCVYGRVCANNHDAYESSRFLFVCSVVCFLVLMYILDCFSYSVVWFIRASMVALACLYSLHPRLLGYVEKSKRCIIPGGVSYRLFILMNDAYS
uniref:Uncharacterized protein n=1 Tax=Leptocylindrus danicus TaxID=163516 RepID=A0A7S2PK70_9STRA